ALIMLAGIYYGAMYGGSTTSILVNVPGEAGSVVTLLDGYQMTRKGRAGAALAIAAVGSFVAGTIGGGGIMMAGGALPGWRGGLAAPRVRHGRHRARPRHRRHGLDLRAAPVHVRLRAALAGDRSRPRHHGPLRRGRDALSRGG